MSREIYKRQCDRIQNEGVKLEEEFNLKKSFQTLCEMKNLTSFKGWFPTMYYFENRITNARTKGYNNVAKSIIKRAYGFRNFNNFRLRVLDA